MSELDERQIFDSVASCAKRLLAIRGVDGYGNQGGFVLATVGSVEIHYNPKMGLSIAILNGKGRRTFVYSEDNKGICNASYLPLMLKALKSMRAALVLDDIANV